MYLIHNVGSNNTHKSHLYRKEIHKTSSWFCFLDGSSLKKTWKKVEIGGPNLTQQPYLCILFSNLEACCSMELYVWIWLQAIWMTFVNWYVLKSSYNIPPSSIPYLIFSDLQTLDNMINTNVLTFDKKPFVKEAILKKHRHQYEGEKHKDHSHHSNMSKLPLIRSLAEIGRSHSSSKSE